MPHFFINSNQKQENKIVISDKETYVHIAKSLRARIGESIKFCDENEIIYQCEISNITKTEIFAQIINSNKSTRKLGFHLAIAQSPLRSDAQLTLVEKATELGAEEVYPIFTDFCALAQNIAVKKVEKWQKTMFEASKQCERANIPICHPLSFIKELPFGQFDKVIVFAERDSQMSLKKFIEQNPLNIGTKLLVIIGPEGGFSQEEFQWFRTHNLPLVSLGELILKAETAAITGIGNIIYGYSE